MRREAPLDILHLAAPCRNVPVTFALYGMNIRVLAFTAIGMGVLVVALAAALPWIAEQSYVVLLKRYGAEELARSAASEALEQRRLGLAVSIFLGLASVVAGVLLLQHRRIGARLWLIACAGFIVFSVADYALTGLSVSGVLRLLFWGAALLVSIPVLRKQGPVWFSRRV
jgi:hypothetical protein